MNSKKRFLTLLVSCLVLFSGICYGETTGDKSDTVTLPAALADVSGAGTLPTIVGETAVLIDAKSGQVLFNKDMHATRYPASTTKVITGFLALENLNLEDKIVIDAEASATTGSRIYLSENEEVTVRELMYAMMLESANDAAVALAKTVSGSVSDFAALMNKRAKELGAQNTNFNNPNGLPDETHVTTAYDLAMIAKEAMKNEDFRFFVSTVSYIMEPTNKQPEQRIFNNSNRLLFDESRKFDNDGTLIFAKYDGATGVKTGFTKAAGSCLVASAERDGRELIAVILKSNSEQIFVDAHKLLDYGFTYYEGKQIVQASQSLGNVDVKKGAAKKIEVVTAEPISLTLPAGTEWGEIELKKDLPNAIEAPVEAGQKIGTVTAYYNGDAVGVADVAAKEAVMTAAEAKAAGLIVESGDGVLGGLLKVIKFVAITAVVLAVCAIAFVILINHLYKKKKKARKKQRKLREEKDRRKAMSDQW